MPTKEPKTILFLLNDTDLILLNVIKAKFQKDSGWESIIATGYDEAVTAFEKEKPDSVLTEIIINDYQGRTGFDFIKEIQGKKNEANPQIIIFTERGLDIDRDRATVLGVKHYFVKSKISLNELIEEIKRIVN